MTRSPLQSTTSSTTTNYTDVSTSLDSNLSTMKDDTKSPYNAAKVFLRLCRSCGETVVLDTLDNICTFYEVSHRDLFQALI